MKQRFSVKKRIESFKYAFQGILPVYKNDHNIYVHTLAAVLVIVAGIYYNLTNFEWIAIIACIGFVFVCEFINSAIEKLANIVNPEYNTNIKIVKDIAAAAVLISAITAATIGILIFYPKL